jgi:hypothetical protein
MGQATENGRRWGHFGLLALLSIAFPPGLVIGQLAAAQPAATSHDATSSFEKAEAVSTPPVIDAHGLVHALVSRNAAPRLIRSGGSSEAVFPASFDWAEYARTRRALRTLIEHAEDGWPEMVRHLDDGRYSTTVNEAIACDYALNWTVGDVCREIIGGALTQSYLPRLGPLNKMTHARLELRHLTADTKKLQTWCAARSAKLLYELQADFCDLALEEVERGDWPSAMAEKRRQWAAALKTESASLRAAKKACHFQGFGESMRGYRPAGTATASDARTLVEALANRNPSPEIITTSDGHPVFAKNYDWQEYGRAWGRSSR